MSARLVPWRSRVSVRCPRVKPGFTGLGWTGTLEADWDGQGHWKVIGMDGELEGDQDGWEHCKLTGVNEELKADCYGWGDWKEADGDGQGYWKKGQCY